MIQGWFLLHQTLPLEINVLRVRKDLAQGNGDGGTGHAALITYLAKTILHTIKMLQVH
jgi:hypothetical protein